MKQWTFLLFLVIQIVLSGCSVVRDVGDPIGATVGDVSDELGGEKKIGEGEGAIIVHPQDDKKIKMSF